MLATIHLYGTKHMTHHSEAATKKARLCLVVGLACIASLAGAQSPHRLDVTAVGTDPHWKVAGRTTSIVDMKGKRALRLSEVVESVSEADRYKATEYNLDQGDSA